MEKQNILKYIAGGISLLVSIFLTTLFSIIVVNFQPDFIGSEIAFIVGLIIPILVFVITGWIDANFEKKKENSNTLKKWLVIIGIDFVIYLIVLVIFATIASFDFSFNLTVIAQKNLILYGVVMICCGLIGLFIYFGVRQFKVHRIHIPKTSALIAIGLIFMVGCGFGLNELTEKFYSGTIKNGTGYNDGPWLTYNADPTDSMAISWLTSEKNSSIVYYGTDPNHLDQIAIIKDQSNLHKIFLDGLSPDTTYFYRIPENFDTNHSSNLFTFKTAPDSSEAFKFAVFGDKQPTLNDHTLISNKWVADGLIAEDYDFVCQVGDLASAGDGPLDWHLTLESLARLGANTPLMMTIGNHDWSGITGSTNWAELFSYPLAGSGVGRYYSFDYGNAHFVMIDNFEEFYAMSQQQLNWLEEDLTTAKNNGQDWTFCFFHLSMMTTATSGMFQDLQRQIVPIMDKYAVDAVFYGHDHHYEHYNYTYGNNDLVYSPEDTWDHNSVQYFCTGGGGANLEVGYGVLTMESETTTADWYNLTAGAYQKISYESRQWNASRYVENPGFAINYTQYDANGLYDGKYYYHYPAYESYHDEVEQLGFDYGEQSYHYIEVSIDGDECTITTKYPNGVMMSGPGGIAPQTWHFVK